MKRIPLLLTAAVLGGAAHAENYVAKIYGVPSGFDQMVTGGAGDNGMMTGFVTLSNVDNAATLTPQGFRNLHPSGFDNSRITNSWGNTYHVGYGSPTGIPNPHALFWVGGGPAADLHPTDPNVLGTQAFGVEGQYQCGTALMAGGSQACRWNRTAASFALLPTTGFTNTVAIGMDTSQFNTLGTYQAGYGTETLSSQTHAVLWHNLGNGVDLNPAGYFESRAAGCAYPLQGGYVNGTPTGFRRHAAKWSTTAVSFVDINPNDRFIESEVTAVRGLVYVGFGKSLTQQERNQAILWHENYPVDAWMNLHARLPYPYQFWQSFATDIDNIGNVIGYIQSPFNGSRRPVVWVKVPS
jgi:hypothetical protein